jgi:hypothetical protein
MPGIPLTLKNAQSYIGCLANPLDRPQFNLETDKFNPELTKLPFPATITNSQISRSIVRISVLSF